MQWSEREDRNYSSFGEDSSDNIAVAPSSKETAVDDNHRKTFLEIELPEKYFEPVTYPPLHIYVRRLLGEVDRSLVITMLLPVGSLARTCTIRATPSVSREFV